MNNNTYNYKSVKNLHKGIKSTKVTVTYFKKKLSSQKNQVELSQHKEVQTLKWKWICPSSSKNINHIHNPTKMHDTSTRYTHYLKSINQNLR